MQLAYTSKAGLFAFAVNAAEVTSRTALLRAPTGRPLRYRVALHVRAYLEGLGQAALTALELALRRALLVPYGTLALIQDSGAASSAAIASNNSISGVVVVDGPHFGEAQGAEFVTRRTCEFTAEAEYVIADAAKAVIHFEESVTITGTGGPVVSWRPAVNAAPVKQTVYPRSTVKVVQAGTAVGHLVRPPAAPPLFPPAVEHQDRRRVTGVSPKRVGPYLGSLVEPAVSWSYEFESDVPLVALPNIPPL